MMQTEAILPPVSSEAPVAPPTPEPVMTKAKIRKRAIVYAILFDVGVSASFGAVMGFIYLGVITGGSFIYFTNIAEEIGANPIFQWMGFVVGSLVSVMAGYLAAQIGRSRPYAHALWASGIFALVSILSNYQKFTMILTKSIEVHFTDTFNIVVPVLMIGMYAIGAFLYERVNEQS